MDNNRKESSRCFFARVFRLSPWYFYFCALAARPEKWSGGKSAPGANPLSYEIKKKNLFCFANVKYPAPLLYEKRQL
ncbi:MAG: hypothetical protein HFE86_02125 [Clostridiales bacterium]|nr:hypothetical protein [Clostridiales bacterium]